MTRSSHSRHLLRVAAVERGPLSPGVTASRSKISSVYSREICPFATTERHHPIFADSADMSEEGVGFNHPGLFSTHSERLTLKITGNETLLENRNLLRLILLKSERSRLD